MTSEQIEEYLCSLLKQRARVKSLMLLGRAPDETHDKANGYGTPIRVDYTTEVSETYSAVIHTISPGPFGHEHMADRAQILLWQYKSFNLLPTHVRVLDVAGIGSDEALLSLGKVGEL